MSFGIYTIRTEFLLAQRTFFEGCTFTYFTAAASAVVYMLAAINLATLAAGFIMTWAENIVAAAAMADFI